jgi:hypothetical protein
MFGKLIGGILALFTAAVLGVPLLPAAAVGASSQASAPKTPTPVTVRLYRPHAETLSGVWKFPDAKPVM